jgi:hypothetical protein
MMGDVNQAVFACLQHNTQVSVFALFSGFILGYALLHAAAFIKKAVKTRGE